RYNQFHAPCPMPHTQYLTTLAFPLIPYTIQRDVCLASVLVIYFVFATQMLLKLLFLSRFLATLN
ncbi:hypothetical protein, partial [Nostoc linckia]|uniref:hypothetical protein n=2 Tax=Nostoc linckia TaxID=92942 RepID=UPI0015D4FF5A